ncbi:MAG: hypothetical protein KGY81_08735, partial [Phycisphaerae bacterium]|nr:hypothetical protein [Phycisphaerae bacterium]
AAVDVRFVTDHVKLLRFRFFDGVAWSESWAKCDLPTAVEIVIGAEPIGEEASLAEYAAQTMRRVIYVPGGLAAQGAVVRGLGEGGAP